MLKCNVSLLIDSRLYHIAGRSGFATGHSLSQHHALRVSTCSAVPPLHCLLPHPQSQSPPLLPLSSTFLLPCPGLCSPVTAHLLCSPWLYTLYAATSLAASTLLAFHSRQQRLCVNMGFERMCMVDSQCDIVWVCVQGRDVKS